MGTRRWLTAVWLLLALGTTGAAAAQVKAGNEGKGKGAKAPQKGAPAEAAEDKGQAVVESGSESGKPAAEAKAADAVPALTAGDSPPAEPLSAQTAAEGAPAAQTAAEGAPAAEAAGGPAAGQEPKFFKGQSTPYRFLQRAEGRQRYFTEQRLDANPLGQPPRIEPEPARVRGDAAAAIAIGIALEQDWNLDEGYDLFGEDDAARRVTVWFAHDLLSLGERTVLAGEIGAGWGRDTTSGEFDSMDTTLRNTRLQVAVYLRHLVWPVLQPHLRLAGHLSFIEAELDFGEEKYSDDGVSGGGSLGAGFMVRTPTRLFENRKGEFASLSIGLLFEGGYTLASPVSFDLVADEPAGRVEERTAPLGELALSGPYLRGTLLVRF